MVFRKSKKQKSPLWGEFKNESLNFDLVEHYFRNRDKSTAFQVLHDKTMNDIDFYELFAFADRTHSKIGQQYLFYRLLTIDAEKTLMNRKQ